MNIEQVLAQSQERIQAVEEENAHLQYRLEQLDDVLREQSRMIDRLRADLARMNEGLESLGEFVREAPANGLNR
jgi:uncharacterized coiled-coil protein SlyX